MTDTETASATVVAPDPVLAVPPGQAAGPPAGRGRRPTWVLRPLVIFLVSRLITLATLVVTAAISGESLHQEIDRWDSKWWLRAAQFGWPTHLPVHDGHVAGSTVAFFPLFPLSVRWFADLTGASELTAGIVVTTVTGATAMAAAWALVRHYADRPTADRATLLLALFPGSFVLSMVYSEGFAITFLALGMLALLQRRWVVAGLLGLLATATTPIALAFELSCLWCAWRAVSSERDWRSLAAPVLAPLGFVAYLLWLWAHTGNLNAWRLTERGGWNSYPSLAYPVTVVVRFVRDPVAVTKTGDLLFVGTVVAVLAAVVAIRSRLPMPVLLYGLGAGMLGLVSAPIGLRPRFIFLAFPLILAVGARVHGRAYRALVATSAVGLIALTAFSACSWRIFP
jgi:hypothetical protein